MAPFYGCATAYNELCSITTRQQVDLLYAFDFLCTCFAVQPVVQSAVHQIHDKAK